MRCATPIEEQKAELPEVLNIAVSLSFQAFRLCSEALQLDGIPIRPRKRQFGKKFYFPSGADVICCRPEIYQVNAHSPT